ncbi:ankyrin repeat domain-containing protein 50-like isoform X2 [Gigantopelta aegis]|uniref:ankyrin repeat domain-containing protein 50-like isoform X2 n=1 Tax=Gigantopelta aegis TaxID=1735272 RepID=UPI001B88E1A5|nr:ankyrin repeat domain-containing protein 50-like isoform X2 [Gigantopelta aegis]
METSVCLYSPNLLLVDECGDTELICAARKGDVSSCRDLLEAGADVNASNQYNSQTALLVAIDNHHVHVVEVLLAYDADVQMVDNVGITPIYSAIRIKDNVVRNQMVTLLISAGCDVNVGSQDHAPLFLAARLGALSVVQMLCKASCDINVSNKYGVTPIYEAVLNGHNLVLDFLLSQGGCINKQDMYGVSALHVAAMFDKREAVELLLKAGACVKLRDHDGRCAVHVAVEQGKSQVVEIFLKHGVDITCAPTSIIKLPCLRRAAQNGYADTIRVLIRGCSRLPVEEIMEIFSAGMKSQTEPFRVCAGMKSRTEPFRVSAGMKSQTEPFRVSAGMKSRTAFSCQCRNEAID